MTEVVGLARRARAALAHCGGGSLHIQGVGTPHAGTAEALLYDDDGRPTFLCDPSSTLATAAAARRAAVLTLLPAPRDWDDMTGLVLAGHLRVVGTEHVDGASVSVVGLDLSGVVVEHDDPRAASVAQHRIPVAEFGTAAPDAVPAAGERRRDTLAAAGT